MQWTMSRPSTGDDGPTVVHTYVGPSDRGRSIPGPTLASLSSWAELQDWLQSSDDVRAAYGPINAEITADYRRLSRRMRAHLGIDDPCADWCAFAAWVSRQLSAHLGEVAENRQLHHQPWLRRMFILHLRPRLLTVDHWRGLAKANFCIHTEMRAVYELVWELGQLELDNAMAAVDDRTTELLKSERFSAIEVTDDDRFWTRHAVASFLLAAAAEHRYAKSQYLLSASVALSAVEQRRADHLIDEFFEGMVTGRRWIPGPLRDSARRFAVRVTTRYLTCFHLPEGMAMVGHPLPVPDREKYPLGTNPLEQIDNPWTELALGAFWSTDRPRATDWTRYQQRMTMISALFRSYQHHRDIVGFEPDELVTWPVEGDHQPLFAPVDPDDLLAHYPPTARNEPFPLD